MADNAWAVVSKKSGEWSIEDQPLYCGHVTETPIGQERSMNPPTWLVVQAMPGMQQRPRPRRSRRADRARCRKLENAPTPKAT